jgi:hypothetical protein
VGQSSNLRKFAGVHHGTSCSSHVGRDSSVGITTRYGLDAPGIVSLWGGGGAVPLHRVWTFMTCPRVKDTFFLPLLCAAVPATEFWSGEPTGGAVKRYKLYVNKYQEYRVRACNASSMTGTKLNVVVVEDRSFDPHRPKNLKSMICVWIFVIFFCLAANQHNAKCHKLESPTSIQLSSLQIGKYHT